MASLSPAVCGDWGGRKEGGTALNAQLMAWTCESDLHGMRVFESYTEPGMPVVPNNEY